MRVAFYAPMKPPTSTVPSGDLTMARILMECLRKSGYSVEIASEFVSREKLGNEEEQRRLEAAGAAEATQVIARHMAVPPDFWMTYHLYHKAPDWLGPRVARELQIPYIIVEASIAGKQADGPWKHGHDAAKAALSRADLVLQPNPDDLEGVRPWLSSNVPMTTFKVPLDLAPFAAPADKQGLRKALAARWNIDPSVPWIMCAAMMRDGDKLASYRVMAETFGMLPKDGWHMIAAGDGPAEREVRGLFSVSPQVVLPGRLEKGDLTALYSAADIYFWPGVREAFGFSTLEAQAAGLPSVVGDRAGIRALTVPDQSALHRPPDDAQGFAVDINRLLASPEMRAAMSNIARKNAQQHHDINSISAFLKNTIEDAIGR